MSRSEREDKTDLTIEGVIGARRHEELHIARAISAKQVYVLHSRQCIEAITARGSYLRACPYAFALENGVDLSTWGGFEDIAVVVEINEENGSLLPTRTHKPEVQDHNEQEQSDED